MATAKATTDHDAIRKWVEARGGHPARVKATGSRKDPGVLRIDFPGFSGEDTLEEIEWDEFFEWFDRNNLAMLLSPERNNRFSKLVERTSGRSSSKKAASKKSSAKSTSRRVSKSSSRKKASSAKKTSSAKKSSAKKASSSKKSSAKKAGPAKRTSAKKSSAKKSSPAKKTSAKKSTAAKKRSTTRRPVTSSTRQSSTSSKATTDHDEIKRWVEARGGFPATVIGTETGDDDAGVLRIDYPGFSGAGTLERIDWDDWFEKFDEANLAFVYQPKRGSRFSKLVRQ